MPTTFARLSLLSILLLGGCSEPGALAADAGPPPPDAVTFCQDRRTWECERERAAGRITEAEHVSCRTDIVPMCADALWSSDCAVTAERTDACITALSDPASLHTPSVEIVECNADVLCGRR